MRPDIPLTKLTGWGRYPVIEGYELRSEDLTKITERATLSRGLGRSYGDASLPPPGGEIVATSTLADRLLSFDPSTGALRAEAGLSLAKLCRWFLPRGWFVPTSPGTQFVTLGGMVAADVHGKGHHREGSFGEHVTALKMRVADGSILEVSDETHRDLFRATLGGMGLTGHILEVEFRLLQISSPWIHAETEQLGDLDSLIERLTVAGTRWPYTVAWIDGLGMRNGRCPAILQKGRWATAAEAHDTRPRSKMSVPVPLSPPSWLLQPSFVRLFNRAYYRAQGRLRTGRIVHPHAFFYPLDTLGDWNRLYGPQGFTQYQCVVPHTAGHDAVRRLFAALDRAGGAPFLCVLKDFQGQGKGTISFPRAGISIAIDMPVRPEKTPAIVNALNDVVAGDGGCVYLAKDAFTRADHYRAMEPRLDAWMDVRRTWDPDGKLRSALSVRLFGDDA